MVPRDQILNFLALTPNAGPTQTHAGCGLTPYDFLAHVDHVLFEDYFFVFPSILQRCVTMFPLSLSDLAKSAVPVLTAVGVPPPEPLRGRPSRRVQSLYVHGTGSVRIPVNNNR